MKIRIRNSIKILFVSVIAGILFLSAAYALPVEKARKNVEESLHVMLSEEAEKEGDTFRIRISQFNDSFTNALMVQNALEKLEGESPLKHAMYIWHHDLVDDTTWLTEESLQRFLEHGSDGMYLKEYSKYWHGYLVWLKPLLMLMAWDKAEIFLVLLQAFLLCGVVVVSFFEKKAGAGISMMAAFLFMKPLAIWFSLTLSTCWFLAVLASLVIILKFNRLEQKNRREELFFLIGICTSYFDFLTYPIVTLGFPICIWLICGLEEKISVKKKISGFLWLCVCWTAGYVGMWGMKWVSAELLYHSGTLRNSVWSVIYRTSPLDGYTSVLSGIPRTWKALIEQYDSVWYDIVFWLIAALAVISVILCVVKKHLDQRWIVTVFLLLTAGLFPFVWFSLTQNHTAIHCVFTFRILGVSMMALCGVTAVSIKNLVGLKQEMEGLDEA